MVRQNQALYCYTGCMLYIDCSLLLRETYNLADQKVFSSTGRTKFEFYVERKTTGHRNLGVVETQNLLLFLKTVVSVNSKLSSVTEKKTFFFRDDSHH